MIGLLERDGDLAELREAAREAADRRGSVVLVAGEAGIGKSSLVRAWTADPGTDARVLVGFCDDFLTSRTLGPFHDVARAAGGALAEAVASADTSAVLDVLVTELDQPLRPTLLILEDVHWADEATLDVVRYVGRRVARLPAVLAVTFRDDEVGAEHPLTGVLGVLPSTHVRRLRPRRLSQGAVATLTEGTDLDPADVLRSTGGNPFFVTEVVHAGDRVPASVADAVLARLRTLPLASRDAVELLSVLPRPVTRASLDRLLTDADVVAPAEQRGLLTYQDGALGFRHELARRAVLSSLPASLRLRHHETVLIHLQETGADAGAILHHAVEAGRADVIAAQGPTVAHEAFRAGAHRQAEVHQARVLAHSHLLPPEEHAALLEERAWSLYNLHRFEAASKAADAAVALRGRLDDTAAHARAVLTAARVAYMAGRPERCVELIEVAAELAGRVDDPEVEAQVRVNRAALLHLSDHHEEAVAEVTAALALLAPGARPDLRVLGGVYRGGARYFLGEPAGLDELREAITLGLASGNHEPTARGYANLIEFLVSERYWEHAETAIAEAVAFYDDHDFRAHRYNTRGQLAHIALWQGRWDEADERLAELEGLDVEAGVLAAITFGGQAILAVRRGDDDAEEHVARVWDLAVSSGQDWYVMHAACAALELAWTRGDPSLADPYVAPALQAAAGRFWEGWVRWRLHVLGRGQPDAAGLTPGPERTAMVEGWQRGAEAWREVGMPYEQAVELLRSGEEEPTREALAILDRLGAEPAAHIARRRLRELGVRTVPRGPQAATRGNPVGLTDRQVEVLALLAEGLTNAEIAERLVVSVRTVDHHVSAVLQKLEVTSRVEAARRAAELGIVSTVGTS